MPAHRKPTNLVLLGSDIKHNPGRYANRTKEPQPVAPFGSYPASLPDDFKPIWDELLEQAPPGVLTSADRFIFEYTVRLLHKMRTGEISTGEGTQLVSCLARMGLTPSDRSKVSVDANGAGKLIPDSPFAKFLR